MSVVVMGLKGNSKVSLGLLGTPESAVLMFVEAIGRGDLVIAASCLSRDACLITPDLTSVQGRDAIRPLLAQMVASGFRIVVDVTSTVVAGDVAWSRGRWQMLFAGVEGSSFEQSFSSTVVLRKVEGEHWKLQIVAPWGHN